MQFKLQILYFGAVINCIYRHKKNQSRQQVLTQWPPLNKRQPYILFTGALVSGFGANISLNTFMAEMWGLLFRHPVSIISPKITSILHQFKKPLNFLLSPRWPLWRIRNYEDLGRCYPPWPLASLWITPSSICTILLIITLSIIV